MGSEKRTADRLNEVQIEQGTIDGLPYHVISWYHDGEKPPYAAQATVSRRPDGSCWEIGESIHDDRHDAEALAIWFAYHLVARKYPVKDPERIQIGWGG